jgi:AraC family transcriptional regulator
VKFMPESAREEHATALESRHYALHRSADRAEPQATTLYHDDLTGRDSLNQIGHLMPLSLHLRVQERALHYFDSLSSRPDALVPREISVTADQLLKVLRNAGVDIQKLDRSAENAMRLALVATLVETLVPSPPENADKPAVPGLSKRQLMGVLAYIDANIGEPITLANLAARAGLSRMYFARQFRAATGIRPHEYVLRKRVERAQQLLTATSDALANIALSVGFQTQAHFTTVFKKIVGNTPRQWRRKQADAA